MTLLEIYWMTAPYRSKLFVPGSRPELFDKAMRSGADAISIDLEDAVASAERPMARQAVAQFLDLQADQEDPAGPDVVVRVNSRVSGLMIEDLMAIVRPGLAVINLPKVEDPVDVVVCAEVIEYLVGQNDCPEPVTILVTLESPTGIRRADEIAKAHPLVTGLQFGVGDFAISMTMQASTTRLMPIWMSLVGAAREADIAVYDSAFTDIADLEGFDVWAREAKACGFVGKSCVHPSQVLPCNRVFNPTRREIEMAQEVVDAYDEAVAAGRGALTFKGQLVDYPIAEDARRIAQLEPIQDPELR
jgi:citrate lyase subunit beta/citryl-CoA lyase